MSDKLREGTVCFIVKNNKILLALIEYNPTDRKWNGIGGFLEEGETPVEGVVREASEETYLLLDKNHLRKVAENTTSLKLHFFITDFWEGEIKVKEPSLKELKWFSYDEIPYGQMFLGTNKWLPKALDGKLLLVTENQVKEVEKFD